MRMSDVVYADFHCDALWKMLEDERVDFYATEPPLALDVDWAGMKVARSILQTFAIFVPPTMEPTTEPMVRSYRHYKERILAPNECFHPIFNANDLEKLKHDETGIKIGTLLTLEGADRLQGRLELLSQWFEYGVRLIGLTWNNGNWGADGVLEASQRGLTELGKQFVQKCNELGIILDVSHLCDRAFWDMVEHSTRPLVASHSNARAICSHPRNLSDEMIRALITMQGVIGITFVPQFLNEDGHATVDDVLRHIEHICSLGGAERLVFGSDFDGITDHVHELDRLAKIDILLNRLVQFYNEEQVKSFMSGNLFNFLKLNLPKG